MFYGFYFSPSYILVIIGVIICMIASARMNSVFRKYAKVPSHLRMTGRQVAERVLTANGITDVRVEHTSGNLTDHYDPRNKVLRLSDSTYNSTSVAAVGVAAHECGHAVQHANGYVPLQLRSALVPVANFGSSISWPLILVGLLLPSNNGGNLSALLINLGILAFTIAVVFQLVTLPVEFNASSRAVKALDNGGLLDQSELKMTKRVLRAAAMTYVASAASMILQLLRLLLVSSNRRN